MIEFTRPIPIKKTCTMHPEGKAVRSLSFTDDNDHTTTITLCMTCLGELESKAATALSTAITGEGLSSGDFFQGDLQKEFKIGDYIYLTRLRRVVMLETFEDVEAANTTKPIRPATSKEIIEYKKKLGEEA
ncbi:hypothetical protein [Bacillus amyloliquefaciens]|uniref:hypothetical protein n=1 Tax=Bacillus amyloliquefaciens TaxID=1390 RepID=UPI002DC047A3|nr:hypothetical protein [Bacillus amyloliquefaciens]MEC3841545.1 hypothetical protein [Bacillus amyloliquefaciens]